MENAWVPLHSTISFVSHFHYLIEAFLIATVVLLLIVRRRKTKSNLPKLTEQQKDEIIAEWKPEPLVPAVDSNHPCLSPKLVDGKMEKIISINGKKYFNMATSNFLGFVGNQRIEEVAKSTIFKYGVGSCGPRGFYGTVDVHLTLERQLAEFMHCEEAVLYSYGFATIASAIPAYAKRGDIIYADKGVNFAVQKGLQASRSKIEWFEHNNAKDLENLLKAQAEKDKKNPKKAAVTRRFIVVEGLYAKTADLCPLKEIMELKWKHKVRVFIDESYSFGVIGKTGRGVTEHFNVNVIDVDMIMVSLENAVASTGGFCCGRSFVVGHQRLSGLGYCFSASLPPLLTTAASEALRIMDEEPERFNRLQNNSRLLHLAIEKACQGTGFSVLGVDISPLKHIVYQSNAEKQVVEEKLDAVVEELFVNGIVVSRARYLTHEETFPPTPSVKVMCNSEMTEGEIHSAVAAINLAIRNVVGDWSV